MLFFRKINHSFFHYSIKLKVYYRIYVKEQRIKVFKTCYLEAINIQIIKESVGSAILLINKSYIFKVSGIAVSLI